MLDASRATAPGETPDYDTGFMNFLPVVHRRARRD
jgi:hypothetical protein